MVDGAVLAKTCANVYLNMSWIHIYSPDSCRMALREWLRAFGDALYRVDTICGYLIMARQNVASALAGLVEERLMGESGAVDIGRYLFRDNPVSLYGLHHLT